MEKFQEVTDELEEELADITDDDDENDAESYIGEPVED
jgi:hypothetical protein